VILDAELGLSADVLQNMRQMIATAPATFEHRVQTNVLPDLDLEMRRWLHEPGDPVYPIDWTSEKQRRYVMGVVLKKDERGRIIPYKRTHELIDSWDVVMVWVDGSFTIALESHADAAQYVMGLHQQRFHFNTGWQNIRDIATVLSERADELLLQTWSFMLRDIAQGRIQEARYA